VAHLSFSRARLRAGVGHMTVLAHPVDERVDHHWPRVLRCTRASESEYVMEERAKVASQRWRRLGSAAIRTSRVVLFERRVLVRQIHKRQQLRPRIPADGLVVRLLEEGRPLREVSESTLEHHGPDRNGSGLVCDERGETRVRHEWREPRKRDGTATRHGGRVTSVESSVPRTNMTGVVVLGVREEPGVVLAELFAVIELVT